jgi:hypothetical protein
MATVGLYSTWWLLLGSGSSATDGPVRSGPVPEACYTGLLQFVYAIRTGIERFSAVGSTVVRFVRVLWGFCEGLASTNVGFVRVWEVQMCGLWGFGKYKCGFCEGLGSTNVRFVRVWEVQMWVFWGFGKYKCAVCEGLGRTNVGFVRVLLWLSPVATAWRVLTGRIGNRFPQTFAYLTTP